MNRGEFNVDGSEETFHVRPTLKLVKAAINCQTVDTVRIGKNPANGSPETIMLVDDIGAGYDGSEPKPSWPPRSTNSICKPGNPHSIHGDVAICNDEDFA